MKERGRTDGEGEGQVRGVGRREGELMGRVRGWKGIQINKSIKSDSSRMYMD